MAERNLPIDTLRGLACILLVSYHVIGIGPTSGLRLSDDHLLRQINDLLVYVRMPLFSFLSGFVYGLRPYRGNPLGFIGGKIRRLLVPMLLVGTLFAVMQEITPGTNFTGHDWQMLHIIPVAHYWFLESLFFVFLIVASAESLELLQRQSRFGILLLLAAFAYVMDPLPVYFGLRGATYLLPYFLMGLWSTRFGNLYEDAHVRIISGTITGAVAMWIAFQPGPLPQTRDLMALILGLSACELLLVMRGQSRWLAWVGVHSFAIYLFHSMSSAASRIAIERAGGAPVAVLVCAGITAGILGPIVAEFALRRVPPWGYWVLGESPKGRHASRA